MEVLHFSRSFVTFVTSERGNNARLQVESVCTLTDRDAGTEQKYLFYASCKSEDTFAERNLFYKDNYDFCGIFSDEEYVIFRTKATHTEGFREEGLWKNRFEDVTQHLVYEDARLLETPAQIVQASLENIPLVGEVELEAEDGRLRAVLAFPIKTMNANDIQNVYQVDTGPVAFPDFQVSVERHVERLWPAYVAYNAPGFADFVIQQAMQVEGAEVTHYSRIESLKATTRVLAVGS
ncbi:MAG: hypothetical protein O2954_18555 [bacterium]|nr:hypothetical protein [bacterium]